MPIDDHQLDSLFKIVMEHTGMDLTGYRSPSLSRRLSDRLSRLGMDADQYLSICRADPDECEALISAMAIHVSSFFRNPAVFEVLAQSVLPRLMAEKNELRVWSAGCAAGEEAYSVAILIQEERKRTGNTVIRPVVFATDNDRNILEKARKALYPRESLKAAKLGLVDTYFESVGDKFELCAEVKKMVGFSIDDLLSERTASPAESIYGSFDLILCRNVLIYFSVQHQEQVLKKLYDALAIGGVLVLGDSESLLGDLKSRFRTIDPKNRIYQK